MVPRISKLSTLLSASLVALLAPAAALACAGGEDEIEDLTFFDPEVIGRPAEAPFFYDMHTLHGGAGHSAADLTAPNLLEWEAFFQKKLPAADWGELLYKAPLTRLDNLIFLLKGKPGYVAGPEDQPFLDYPDRDTLVAALFYVGFAKRVEPFAMARAYENPWEPKKPADPSEPKRVQSLIAGGGKALAAEKSPFLRQRYALQLLRLHFYKSAPEETVRFYEQRRVDLSAEGSVAWRAMGYAAGAMRRAGRNAEANQIYSVLFDRYEPLKVSAFLSFRPLEEAEWRQSLALARSPREKAVLWQMLGIAKDGVRALREIQALDRKSELLPLLIVREVNREEARFRLSGSLDSPKLEVNRALLTLVEAGAEKGDVAQPHVWDLAAGHLRAMAGDAAAARKLLDRAATRAPKHPAVQRQLRLSQLYATLQGATSQTLDEATVARELTWLQAEANTPETSRVQTFQRWARRRLSDLYRKKGDVVTALCLADQDDPLYADPAQIDRLAAFLQKPRKSAFEAYAAGCYRSDVAGLQELKGLLALYRGQFEQAAGLLASAEGALNADPFVIHVRDCHDCDAETAHQTWQRKDLARRLAELERQAADPAKAAAAYFDLASALYNISYYGNSRLMYVGRAGHFPRPTDNSLAERYYKKALEASTDPEFKAKAAFMAAKCEENAWLSQHPDNEPPFKPGVWFKTLKDGYSQTRYFQEILRECGYFQNYVSQRSSKRAR